MHTFQRALRKKKFTVTAELPLAPTSTVESITADLDCLRGVADAVQVTDSPLGIPHMAPLIAATICLQHGVDPLVHLTGRDRNRIALTSELLGAAAAGITSLYLSRGDKLASELRPRAQKVYEFGAKRLLRTASAIGSEPGLPPQGRFCLGAPATVIAPPDGWDAKGLARKFELGCDFVQTQPLLDVGLLRTWAEALGELGLAGRVAIIVTVPLLRSQAEAEALGQRPRGALLPPAKIAALASEGRAVGRALAAEVLAEARDIPGIAGANLVGCDDAALVAETIAAAG